LDCDPCQLREAPALSCYSAEQAFEARQQVIRCSTSGFFEPQTRHKARRIGEALGRWHPAWQGSWGCLVDNECRWWKPGQADAGW
jgi:hypothetical protein